LITLYQLLLSFFFNRIQLSWNFHLSLLMILVLVPLPRALVGMTAAVLVGMTTAINQILSGMVCPEGGSLLYGVGVDMYRLWFISDSSWASACKAKVGLLCKVCVKQGCTNLKHQGSVKETLEVGGTSVFWQKRISCGARNYSSRCALQVKSSRTWSANRLLEHCHSGPLYLDRYGKEKE